MTTIEQALTEALRTVEDRSHDEDSDQDYLILDSGDYETWAAAILATEPMQAIARWAERGRDVMLAGPYAVWQGACGHVWRVDDDGETCPRCAADTDADRLAEALRDVLMSHGYDISDNAAHAINEDACAALAAHDARKP